MHTGKALTAIITATLISTFAHSASAKKAGSKAPAAATTATTAPAKTTKATKAKAKAKGKAEESSPRTAEQPIAIPAVSDSSSIYDADPWFDQPIAIAAKKKPVVKTKKKAAPRRAYGGAVGLGNRSTGAAPTVTERATDATPKLNHNAVRKVVRANDASVAYCQARARRAKQNVGQQMLSFNVDAHGRASSVMVTDMAGKKQAAMTRCMSRQVKRWKLPAGSRGGNISIPLMHRQIGPSSSK